MRGRWAMDPPGTHLECLHIKCGRTIVGVRVFLQFLYFLDTALIEWEDGKKWDDPSVSWLGTGISCKWKRVISHNLPRYISLQWHDYPSSLDLIASISYLELQTHKQRSIPALATTGVALPARDSACFPRRRQLSDCLHRDAALRICSSHVYC